MPTNSLQLVAAWPDREPARQLAERTGGVCLEATSVETSHLPFAALAIVVTDELDELLGSDPLGVWLVCERTFKGAPLSAYTEHQIPGAVAIYPMVAHADLSPAAADQHWRDRHAPLALEVHKVMTHYHQLAVLHVFKGPAWNGIALCCAQSAADLRDRFFDTPAGERAIAADVSRFADTKRSPRRVIARVSNLGPRGSNDG